MRERKVYISEELLRYVLAKALPGAVPDDAKIVRIDWDEVSRSFVVEQAATPA